MPGFHEEETPTAPGAPELEPICRMVDDVYADLRAAIWTTRSDNRAKVLRTFRSRDGEDYSRRFAWFFAAVFRVIGGAPRDNEEGLRALAGELDAAVCAVARLRESIRKVLQFWPPLQYDDEEEDGPNEVEEALALVHEETSAVVGGWRRHEPAFNKDLKRLAVGLDAVILRSTSPRATLRSLLPPALPRRSSAGDPSDHWDNLYYELRRSGFEVWEIIALCHWRAPDQQTELSHRQRAALRARIKRLFKTTGERKPPKAGVYADR